MVKFENMFGNFAFAGLMVLALLSFAFIIQEQNEASQPISEDELINDSFFNIKETIESTQDSSDTQYNLFSKEKPDARFGSIVLFTLVNVGKTFGNIIFELFIGIIKIPLIILGIEESITSIIISFLTISTIIALWIVYKFGG